MKIYRGIRQKSSCRVTVQDDAPGSTVYDLRPRNDLWNHSPDGFEWGYGGSGPAQLALALLADALGDDALAVELHQHFKSLAIAGLVGLTWRMTEDEVRRFAFSIRRARLSEEQQDNADGLNAEGPEEGDR